MPDIKPPSPVKIFLHGFNGLPDDFVATDAEASAIRRHPLKFFPALPMSRK
ncbi:MAG: hypothetical protein Q8O52_03115 [Sulfuritalea sp.]|nr:hypothetical protein [Sulfuritalea sp.]